MGTVTATVEVLTAEVRVLMVGSRQITASVARQLDVVDLDDINPFGRIDLSDKDPRWVWVIGKSLEDGSLVRAKAYTRPVFDIRFYIPYPVNVCSRHRPGAYYYGPNAWVDQKIDVVFQHEIPTVFDDYHSLAQCPLPYLPEPAINWITIIYQGRVRQVRDHKGAASLPLIVLAGLR